MKNCVFRCSYLELSFANRLLISAGVTCPTDRAIQGLSKTVELASFGYIFMEIQPSKFLLTAVELLHAFCDRSFAGKL